LTDKWLPLIVKFNGYFNTNLKPSKSICVEKIDAVNVRQIEKYLLSLEFAALYGLYRNIILSFIMLLDSFMYNFRSSTCC